MRNVDLELIKASKDSLFRMKKKIMKTLPRINEARDLVRISASKYSKAEFELWKTKKTYVHAEHNAESEYKYYLPPPRESKETVLPTIAPDETKDSAPASAVDVQLKDLALVSTVEQPKETASLPPAEVSSKEPAVEALPKEPTPVPAFEAIPQEPTPVPAFEAIPQEPTPVPAVEALPQEPTPVPAVEALPQEPTPVPAVEALPQEPTPVPTVEALPQEPTPVPTIEATSKESSPVPAVEAKPEESLSVVESEPKESCPVSAVKAKSKESAPVLSVEAQPKESCPVSVSESQREDSATRGTVCNNCDSFRSPESFVRYDYDFPRLSLVEAELASAKRQLFQSLSSVSAIKLETSDAESQLLIAVRCLAQELEELPELLSSIWSIFKPVHVELRKSGLSDVSEAIQRFCSDLHEYTYALREYWESFINFCGSHQRVLYERIVVKRPSSFPEEDQSGTSGQPDLEASPVRLSSAVARLEEERPKLERAKRRQEEVKDRLRYTHCFLFCTQEEILNLTKGDPTDPKSPTKPKYTRLTMLKPPLISTITERMPQLKEMQQIMEELARIMKSLDDVKNGVVASHDALEEFAELA